MTRHESQERAVVLHLIRVTDMPAFGKYVGCSVKGRGWRGDPVAGTGDLGGGTSGSPCLMETPCECVGIVCSFRPRQEHQGGQNEGNQVEAHGLTDGAQQSRKAAEGLTPAAPRVRDALGRRVCGGGRGVGGSRALLGPGLVQSGLGWIPFSEQKVRG